MIGLAIIARMARLWLAGASALGCAGCTDYLAHRDTLILETGEAVQNNIAVHVIDPTPPRSARIVRDTDGERLQHGIERYRNPQPALGGFGGPASVPIGASTASPPANPLNR